MLYSFPPLALATKEPDRMNGSACSMLALLMILLQGCADRTLESVSNAGQNPAVQTREPAGTAVTQAGITGPTIS